MVQTSLCQKRRWPRMVNRFQEHILDNTPLPPFGPLSTGLFWTPTDLFSMIDVWNAPEQLCCQNCKKAPELSLSPVSLSGLWSKSMKVRLCLVIIMRIVLVNLSIKLYEILCLNFFGIIKPLSAWELPVSCKSVIPPINRINNSTNSTGLLVEHARLWGKN